MLRLTVTSRRLRTRRRLAIAGSFGLLLGTMGAGVAEADLFAAGYPNSGFRPDTSQHTYCWGGSFSSTTARSAANYAMANLDNQTTMYDTYVSCSSLTDVVWIRTYDPGDGYYHCRSFNVARECERAIVALNFGWMNSSGDWRQTACHEVGHSVGLTHYAYDCLGSDSARQQYGSHHVGHVNLDR